MNVLMAAGGQYDAQHPEKSLPPGLGIRDMAKPAKVDLGQIARLAFGHPDGDLPPLGEAAVLDGETLERTVGHTHAMPDKEFVYLAEPQAALLTRRRSEPLPGPLLMGEKVRLGVSGRSVAVRTQASPDLDRFARRRPVSSRGSGPRPRSDEWCSGCDPSPRRLRSCSPRGPIAAGH